jgi:signal transduction histidine kinase
VADASHELRTPLAVLDARLQILQRTLPADDPSAEVVAELRRDTTSLIRIVNDLLESAEFGGVATATSEAVDVVAAVDEAVRAMSVIAAEKQVGVVLTAVEPASAHVPPSAITRCAIALIDNALRFAPSGSTVTVTVAVSPKAVSVIVRDHGPGIQGIEPSRIFDRFAHSGAAADGGNGTKARFGIGLSLVRETCVRYGGSAEVVASSASGTAISFSIPRARRR